MKADFEAQIMKITGGVRQKKGVTRRLCQLTLFRELNGEIADLLGGAGPKVLRALKANDVSEAKIKLDALVFEATIDCKGQQVTIGHLRGIVAKGKEGARDEEPPTVKLVFGFDFQEDAWSLFGRNYGSMAQVKLEPAQAELAVDDGVAAEDTEADVQARANGEGKRKRKPGRPRKSTPEQTAGAHGNA